MITDKRFLPGPSPRLPKKNVFFSPDPVEPRNRKPSNNELAPIKKPSSNNDLLMASKIHFHEYIHGKNILITHHGRKASRIDGFYDLLTFSNRPLMVNEYVSFKITEVDRNRSGVLAIGLTYDDPERYRTLKLPTAAELLPKPGTRFVKLDDNYCQKNVQINLRLTDHGDLHMMVNDESQEYHLLDRIDIGRPQWLLIDVFGRCITLEFVEPYLQHQGRKPEAKIKPFARQQSIATLVQIGEYEYVEEPSNRLGQGTFGEVWKGLSKKDNVEVAVKKLPKEDLAELHVMGAVRHPNLMKMYGSARKGPYFYVITELCSMDLEKFLKNHVPEGRLNLENLKILSKQLASGYIVLHAAEIIHRDIKPQNILVNISNNRATIKIADFGCGKFMDGELYANTVAGTLLYMAPELGSKWATKSDASHYDARADIWSLGLVIYESALGHLPYDQKTLLEFFVAVGKSPRQAKKMKPKIPSNLDKCLQEMLNKMLKPLYQDRMHPTAFFENQFHTHISLTCHIFF